MFRGDPTIAIASSDARLPGTENAPSPTVKLVRGILVGARDQIVYAHTLERLQDSRDGYTQVERTSVREQSCSPTRLDKSIDLGGMIPHLLTSTIFAADKRCTIGSSYMRWQMVELKDVSGILFPLATGEILTFSARELVHQTGDTKLTNPIYKILPPDDIAVDSGFSDRERWIAWRAEVTQHLDSYRLKNGKDVGEVYVVRVSSGSSFDDFYFSTKLNWPVMRKQSNGLVVEATDWE